MPLGQDLVVIERDSKRLEWIHDQYPDVLTVTGDATLDVNLAQAGIQRARASSRARARIPRTSSYASLHGT